jgi:hypothetical protein
MRAFAAALGLQGHALEPATDFWQAGGDSLAAGLVSFSNAKVFWQTPPSLPRSTVSPVHVLLAPRLTDAVLEVHAGCMH